MLKIKRVLREQNSLVFSFLLFSFLFGFLSAVCSVSVATNVLGLCVVVELEPQKLKFITNVK